MTESCPLESVSRPNKQITGVACVMLLFWLVLLTTTFVDILRQGGAEDGDYQGLVFSSVGVVLAVGYARRQKRAAKLGLVWNTFPAAAAILFELFLPLSMSWLLVLLVAMFMLYGCVTWRNWKYFV